MDWLTFFAKIVEAMAWPVTALLIAFILRKHVLAILPTMTELTLPGGVAARFNTELVALKQKTAAGLVDEAPKADSSSVKERERRYSVARAPQISILVDEEALKNNPNGVVMESWKEIEAAMRDILVDARVATLLTVPQDPRALIALLQSNKLVSPPAFSTLHSLLELRNLAAHSRPGAISAESADTFRQMAQAIIVNLRNGFDAIKKNAQPSAG